MSGRGGEGHAPAGGEEDLAAVELVAVARVVKTRGVRGEVAADLLTDFPERFDGLERLIAVTPQTGARERLTIEEHWLHGERAVFKFAGYDSPEASAALVGRELTVPEDEAVELEEGEYFDWQLEGCRVETVEGRQLGAVKEILRTGGEAPVIVVDAGGGREHLIPFAVSICVEVDTDGKLIRVDPPEGLLE